MLRRKILKGENDIYRSQINQVETSKTTTHNRLQPHYSFVTPIIPI